MADPLWFHLKNRGQPPRFFLRDEFNGMTPEDAGKCQYAYTRVIIPILAGPDGKEPEGVKGGRAVPNMNEVWRPRYKGFIYPLEKKGELIVALTKQMGEPGEREPDFSFPDYKF